MTAKRTAVGRTLRSTSAVPSKRDACPLSPRVEGVGKSRRRNLYSKEKPTAGEIRASANESDDDEGEEEEEENEKIREKRDYVATDDDNAMAIDFRMQRNNDEIREVRRNSSCDDHFQRLLEKQQKEQWELHELLKSKKRKNDNEISTRRYEFVTDGSTRFTDEAEDEQYDLNFIAKELRLANYTLVKKATKNTDAMILGDNPVWAYEQKALELGIPVISMTNFMFMLCCQDKKDAFEKLVEHELKGKKIVTKNEPVMRQPQLNVFVTGEFTKYANTRLGGKDYVESYAKNNKFSVSKNVSKKTDIVVLDESGGTSYVRDVYKINNNNNKTIRFVTFEKFAQFVLHRNEMLLNNDEIALAFAAEILAKDTKKRKRAEEKENDDNDDGDYMDGDSSSDDEDDNDDGDYMDEDAYSSSSSSSSDDEDDDDDNDDDDDQTFESDEAVAKRLQKEFGGQKELGGGSFLSTLTECDTIPGSKGKTPTTTTEQDPKRRSAREKATIPTAPKWKEEQPCANGVNCSREGKEKGLILAGEKRYYQQSFKNKHVRFIAIHANILNMWICRNCYKASLYLPSFKCVDCQTLREAGFKQRRETPRGTACGKGFCVKGDNCAAQQFPSFTCPVCKTLRDAGFMHRRETPRGTACAKGRCRTQAKQATEAEIAKRPHKCHLCSWAFATKSNLRAHLTTHDVNRQRFSCDMCDASYTMKFKLKVHMEKRHA